MRFPTPARHEWIKVKARTPSGKTRIVRQCKKCKLLTYSVGKLTGWKYADGHVAETATIDEPSCHGPQRSNK